MAAFAARRDTLPETDGGGTLRGGAGAGSGSWLGVQLPRPPLPGLANSRHDLLDVEVGGPVLLDARHVAHPHDAHHHGGDAFPGLGCGRGRQSVPASYQAGGSPGQLSVASHASPSEARGSSRRRAACRSM